MEPLEQQILYAVSICLPVFALMGLGIIIKRKGLLTSDRQNFLNGLVYSLGLPALIFSSIATQPIENFLFPGFYWGIILPIIILILVYAVIGRGVGLRQGRWALCIVGTFWANVSYLGFPLAESAFGEAGLQMAAVYNAVAMPLYMVLGVSILSWTVKNDDGNGLKHILSMLKNPIILSALLGLFFVGARHALPLEASPVLQAVGSIGLSFCSQLGAMGLPLALIVIGGSLEWSELKGCRRLVFSIAMAKLIFLPGLAWLLFTFFFSDLPAVAMQTGVLLSAMPSAIAAYVIGMKMGIKAQLLSSLLVVTTLGSIVTVPFWVFVLLR